VFGRGALTSLGDEIRLLGGTKALVVTDPGIRAAGLLDRVVAQLETDGIAQRVFADVTPDPAIEIAEASVEAAKVFAPDVIVGFGGGSCLDIAKLTSVLLINGGPVERYFGIEQVPKPGIPLILIPTTAGTGSEVTSISVLADTRKRVKKGIVSAYLSAKTALLDPLLTLGLPPHVTVYTGLDALVHAIESYTGRQSTYLTEPLALEAVGLIARHLRKAYADGSNIDARSGMLQASLLAGMAFSNTQTAGAHACALSLGARFNLPHGVATALMLPAVMRFNSIAAPEKFARIARAFDMPLKGLTPMQRAGRAVEAVEALMCDVGFQRGIERHGVRRAHIPDLADSAMQAARLWNNNPRQAGREQVCAIFEAAFSETAGG
jgi:alcohol dehydrogenase class IV